MVEIVRFCLCLELWQVTISNINKRSTSTKDQCLINTALVAWQFNQVSISNINKRSTSTKGQSFINTTILVWQVNPVSDSLLIFWWGIEFEIFIFCLFLWKMMTFCIFFVEVPLFCLLYIDKGLMFCWFLLILCWCPL